MKTNQKNILTDNNYL